MKKIFACKYNAKVFRCMCLFQKEGFVTPTTPDIPKSSPYYQCDDRNSLFTPPDITVGKEVERTCQFALQRFQRENKLNYTVVYFLLSDLSIGSLRQLQFTLIFFIKEKM